jgi:hypothetical protein
MILSLNFTTPEVLFSIETWVCWNLEYPAAGQGIEPRIPVPETGDLPN